MTPAPTIRFQSLDSLRGIAALAVLIFHYTTNYHAKFGHSEALPASLPFGHYGVELFFVISGFVIMITIDRSAKPVDFIFSRATRLFPAYWSSALLTFAAVTTLGLEGREIDLSTLAINLTMMQGFFSAEMVDQVYWTLHKELGFYLLAGSIAYSGGKHLVAPIFVALTIFQLAATHLSLDSSVPGLWRLWTIFPLEFIHLFLLGVIAWEFSAKSRKFNYLAACIAFAGAFNMGGTKYMLVNLGAFVAVIAAIRYRPRPLESGVLVYFGTISYSLYLLHANIGYIVIRELEAHSISPISSILVATLASIVLASTVTYLIERPAMFALRRIYRGRRAATGFATDQAP